MNINKIDDHEFGEVYDITRDRQPEGGKAKNMHSAKNPRTRSLAATSDCIVTYADGTSRTIPKYSRREPSAAQIAEREKRAKERARERANRLIDIQNARDARRINVRSGRFGYIGNID